MTNEEKAKEILQCEHCLLGQNICFGLEGEELPCKTYEDLMLMAQWKDEKFAKEKQQMIKKACEWLAVNDSYATPTNVMVDNLREHLNNIK